MLVLLRWDGNLNNPITASDQGLNKNLLLVCKKIQSCMADELEISQLSVSRIIFKTINSHFSPHVVQQLIKFPLGKWKLNQKKDYIDHETIHCIFVKTIRVIHFADFVQYVRDSADMLMQHFHMLIKTDSEMHHIVCRLLAYKLIFLRLHWGAGTRKNSYLPIQMFFFKLILLLFSILFALILRQTVY